MNEKPNEQSRSIFRDKLGNEWVVELTVGALKRVLTQTGVDLMQLFEPDEVVDGSSSDEGPKALRKLLLNPVVIADVLFAVVAPQAAEKNVSAEAFGNLLAGKSLAEATDALMSELEVFFSARDADMGATVGGMVRKFNEARSVVWNRARGMMERLDPTQAANEAFDKELAKRNGRVNSGA